MTETVETVFKSLEMRIQRLMEHVKFLQKDKNDLQKELVEKEETIKRLKLMLEEEKEKNKLLAVASVIKQSEKGSINEATRQLNSLVREIDECIALLTKE